MAIKARVEAFHEIKSKSFINNWTRQPSDKRRLVRGNVGVVNDDGVDVAEGGGSADASPQIAAFTNSRIDPHSAVKSLHRRAVIPHNGRFLRQR